MASGIANSAANKALNLIQNLGRSVVATQYPDDFEYYMCSLELVNSRGNTIDFFTFPIMPDGINKIEPKRNTVRSTLGGLVVLSSPTAVTQTISLQGNFGRMFKILLSGNTPSLQGIAFSLSAGKKKLYQIQGKNTSSLKGLPFDVGIKTGYGCVKILQSIIDKSNGVDETGKPLRLYFYNMAFGESYLVAVPPSGVSFTQNLQKNMIWEYNLNLSSIAPLEAVVGSTKIKTTLLKACAADAIQKSVNGLAKDISSSL